MSRRPSAEASAFAISVFPTPASPSTKRGFPSRSARYSVTASARSAMYRSRASPSATSSIDDHATPLPTAAILGSLQALLEAREDIACRLVGGGLHEPRADVGDGAAHVHLGSPADRRAAVARILEVDHVRHLHRASACCTRGAHFSVLWLAKLGEFRIDRERRPDRADPSADSHAKVRRVNDLEMIDIGCARRNARRIARSEE